MKPRAFLFVAAGSFLSLHSALGAIGVTNGTFGTTNHNAQYVDGGGWYESTITTDWVEGSWSNGNATSFPTGMACLFDGAAANGYIYQSLGTLTADDIALGGVRITCDFSEKTDDTTVDGTFHVYAGTMASPANGTDISGAGLTTLFSRTMTAADQGLTAAGGNQSRQSRTVGTVNVTGLAPGTQLWIRVGRPSSGAGDFIIDNLAASVVTAPRHWDLNGVAAGAGGATPSGSWDGAAANWNASADGTGTPAVWSEGTPAVFSAGTDATGSYTVTVSGTRSASSLTLEEGTLLLTGGEITLASPATVTTSTGTQMRIESGLGGTSGVTTAGTGTTILAGANTYSGTTTLAGTVRLDGGAAIPDASPVVGGGGTFTLLASETIGDLSGTGTFALGGATLSLGTATAATTFSGGFSGAGTLVKQGSGTMTLTGGSPMTGAVVVNGGTLSTQGPAADGVFPNASGLTINNGGTVASGSNGLFGYNNHPVPVTVNAGGTLTVNGGANGGPNIFGTITLAGGTVAEAASVHATYGSYNFGGASITATGSTTSILSARDFQFRNSATTVQVDSGSTLNVTGYFTGLAHAGGKALNKTGTGRMILASATASSHGPTNVNGGTLELNGLHGTGKITVASGATLTGGGTTDGIVEVQPGGQLTMANSTIDDLAVNNSATLAGTTVLEITKTGGTPAADRVNVTSSLTYGGTLTVTDITSDATALAAGDSFKLFDSPSYGGGFSTFNLPTLPAGLSWDKSTLATTGSIVITNNVSTPVFTPPGGGYAGEQSVTISSDSGSTIYYTTDGSPPGPTSPNGPSPITGIIIPTDSSVTLSAYAVKDGQGDSATATAQYTTVTTPTWIEGAGGNWSGAATANWLNGVVANGANVTADFSTLTLDADKTVNLSEARTIGHLVLGDVGDARQWTLAGSDLTLAGTSPSITVENQRTIISTSLQGVSGMRKEGAGALRLTANAGYSGNTVVNAGMLELAAGSGAYTSSTIQGTLTVNTGATASLASATAFGWGGGLSDVTLAGGQLIGTAPQAYGVSYHLDGGTINVTGALRMGVLTGFSNVVLDSSASATTSVVSAGSLELNPTFGQNSLTVTVAAGTTPSGVDLRINAPITGGYTLVKEGAGNLLLAAANTYSVGTTVNAGILTLDGSVTSPVSVNGTAVLAGTGTAAGGSTIGDTAFLAPGGTTTGEFHSGAVTLNGTYRFQVDGASSDLLTVNGNLTFGPSSIIACSALAGGFTGESYVVASYTGTLTGTPTAGGLPEGYALDLSVANQIRLVRTAGYGYWADLWVEGQTADLDHDHDGIPNGVEFFMGETSPEFTAGSAIVNGTLTWPKGSSYTGTYGVDYWVETSPDMGTSGWTMVPAEDPALADGASLSYTLPAGETKLFVRLVVSVP